MVLMAPLSCNSNIERAQNLISGLLIMVSGTRDLHTTLDLVDFNLSSVWRPDL